MFESDSLRCQLDALLDIIGPDEDALREMIALAERRLIRRANEQARRRAQAPTERAA
jgi:hypothetical protein